MDKKICRHKINAIRGDKEHKAEATSDAVIPRLKKLFGIRTTLRQYLEDNWRNLREYAGAYPDNSEEIENRRKIIGEALSNGFVNTFVAPEYEPFDFESWESSREILFDHLDCRVDLTYEDDQGETTTRCVDVSEVFLKDSRVFLFGFCHLRGENRSFRSDRIKNLVVDQNCKENEKNIFREIMSTAIR